MTANQDHADTRDIQHINSSCNAEGNIVIRDSVTDKSCAGWLGLLMAGSIAGSLLVVPVVQAAEETSGQGAQTAPAQGAWGAYPAPGAVPPPPGPYSSGTPGMPPQFRPDQELENSGPGYAPPPPPQFQGDPNSGPVTRDQFLSQQEDRRKQMDQDRQEREAEMQKRRDEMQAQREGMRQQQGEDPCIEAMEQRSEERRKEWDQRKAEQEKRWEQLQTEQQQRWDAARQAPPGRPGDAAQQQQQAAPATGQQQAPAYGYQGPGYGYPPPAPGPGYGYGYPPPPPGYGAPGWGYPGYPAPAAGGSPTASEQGQ